MNKAVAMLMTAISADSETIKTEGKSKLNTLKHDLFIQRYKKQYYIHQSIFLHVVVL